MKKKSWGLIMKRWLYLIAIAIIALFTGCVKESENITNSDTVENSESDTEVIEKSSAESEEEPVQSDGSEQEDVWRSVSLDGQNTSDGLDNINIYTKNSDGEEEVYKILDQSGNELWSGLNAEKAYVIIHDGCRYWVIEGTDDYGDQIARASKVNQELKMTAQVDLWGSLDATSSQISVIYTSTVGMSICENVDFGDLSVSVTVNEGFTASGSIAASITRSAALEGVYDCVIMDGAEVLASSAEKYSDDILIKIYRGGMSGWVSLSHIRQIDSNLIEDESVAYFSGFSEDEYALVNAHISVPGVEDGSTRVKTCYECCAGVLQVGERHLTVVQYLEPVLRDGKYVLEYNCYLYTAKDGKLSAVSVDGYNLNGGHIPVRLLNQKEDLMDSYISEEESISGIEDETVISFSDEQTIMIGGVEYGFESDAHLAVISEDGSYLASDEKSVDQLSTEELESVLINRLNIYQTMDLYWASIGNGCELTDAVYVDGLYEGKQEEDGGFVYAAVFRFDEVTDDNDCVVLALFDGDTLDLLEQTEYYGKPVQTAVYEKADKTLLILIASFWKSYEGNYQEQFLLDFSAGALTIENPLKNYEKTEQTDGNETEVYCNIAEDGTLEVYEFPYGKTDPDDLDAAYSKTVLKFNEETGEFTAGGE